MENERAVVAVAGVESIQAVVPEVIELAGGLNGLEPGMVVLIKPNVNSDDLFPATSNPQTIAALIDYVKKYNPKKVIVADSSNVSYLPTVRSMGTLGIYQAAADAGAEVIGFEDEEWVEVSPPGATHWRRFEVPKMLLEADYVISQCVVKTHFKAVYSMALKNWMGVVDHRSRYSIHISSRNVFYKRVAELNLARPADYVLLDGTRAMVSGGPFSGDVVEADLMVATANLTAADATGLAILKYLGTEEKIQKPRVWDQPVLRHGIEIGLGAGTGSQIDLLSHDFDDVNRISDYLEIPEELRRTA
ncbi:MAG: DUF362 domain-containing protein [Candidatus Aquicultor sp.]